MSLFYFLYIVLFNIQTPVNHYIKPVNSSMESHIWYWNASDSILFQNNYKSSTGRVEYHFQNNALFSLQNNSLKRWLYQDSCWVPFTGNRFLNTYCLLDNEISPQQLDSRKHLEWQIVGDRIQNRWNLSECDEYEFSSGFPRELIPVVVLKLI